MNTLTRNNFFRALLCVLIVRSMRSESTDGLVRYRQPPDGYDASMLDIESAPSPCAGSLCAFPDSKMGHEAAQKHQQDCSNNLDQCREDREQFARAWPVLSRAKQKYCALSLSCYEKRCCFLAGESASIVCGISPDIELESAALCF